MPRSTFFNLPRSKREKIIEVAIDEFADSGYATARVNEIVRKASIAKGSFYQYFQDKKDLFGYILELIYEKKMAALSDIMARENSDVFQIMRAIAQASIELAEKNPKLSRISDRLFAEPALLKEILQEYRPSSDEFFENLIRQGLEKGDIAPWIEPSLAGKLISSFVYALGDIVRSSSPDERNEETKKKWFSMVDIMEKGMRRRE